ncbi:MAG: hypothetical protein EOR72_02090 [Mesorhizobium sp.]|uniref:hypothetical protein n=1 Tax=Mesorhizobium sp. TaxID=1871066 RepID=UPI000FE49E29|nr:hypothetical protein [Mesorhizobium sp.]RWM20010.1 MAG: hypothetical protein EOR72_02090 [Mesorhizobium sp.]
MFLADGKITTVKELADGRFAYSRGATKPAAIVTKEQLEDIQRLNATRIALPFSFLALGAVIIFILTKDDLPLPASVAVGAVAVALSVYVITAMTNRIAEILNAAPHEAALPARIPLSAFFVDLLSSSSNLDVLVGKWFWGCMCIASIVVPPAKYLKSENIGWTDALAMLAFCIFSYVLFRAFSAERQRRKDAAVTDKA